MNYFIIEWPTWLDEMGTKKESRKKQPVILREGLDTSDAHNVTKMLSDIPLDLWNLFAPSTEDELLRLEARLVGFAKFQADRDRIRFLQIQFNLPFRPNASLAETITKVRIKLLAKGISKKHVDAFMDIDLRGKGDF